MDEYYEYLKGYADNEYKSGVGYYNIDSNKFTTRKQGEDVYRDKVLSRFQFKNIDDDLLEEWFGYELVDRVGYFLSDLRRRALRLRGRNVYLSFKYLRAVLGDKNVDYVLRMLEDEDVFTIVRTQLKGVLYKKKRGYGFNIGSRLLKSDYIEREVVNKKLKRWVYKEKDVHRRTLNEECLYLHDIVSRVELSVDVEDILKEFPLEEHGDVRMRIDLLDDNDIGSYRVDEHGRRLYYPVSSLNSEVRKYLRLDGEEFVEFDMRTGYFSLLYLLLRGLKEGLYYDIIDEEVRRFAEGVYIGEEWFDLYRECFKGEHDFYRMVSIRLGKGMGLFKSQRVDIKDALIRELNGRADATNRLLGVDRVKLRSDLYGDVEDFIMRMKSSKIYKEHLNGYYKNVSKCLMSMEVRMMKKVWKQLRDRGIDYLSIHDCVMVKVSDRDRLKEILDSITAQYYVIRFIEK
jgi:hypothetical protein